MGSAYGMFKRSVKLSHAFAGIAADPAFVKKCGISQARAAEADAAEAAAAEEDSKPESLSDSDDSSDDTDHETATGKRQQDYLEVRRLMKDDEFVADTQAAIDFVRPVMQVLRVADRKASQHPVVWERMAHLDEHYSNLCDNYEGPIPMDQVSDTHQCVVDRWTYLHDKTHSAACALNPHFHEVDVMAETSVMEDLETVFADFYSDPDDLIKVGLEFHAYKTKDNEHWKKPLVWPQAKHLSPWAFWNMHGGCSPLLRKVALVVLRLNHAAGGCERNWSAHDFLYSKRRASTSVEVLSKEVYYYGNSRMADERQSRGRLKKRKVIHYDENGVEVLFPLWGDKCANSGPESD